MAMKVNETKTLSGPAAELRVGDLQAFLDKEDATKSVVFNQSGTSIVVMITEAPE